MSRTNRPETLLEEARLLMPWYLTGQLSAEEKKLVEDALAQYPSLHDEFAREEQIKKLVRQDAHLLELSALDTTPQRLENLLKRIGREMGDEKVQATSAFATKKVTKSAVEAKPSFKTRLSNAINSVLGLEWLTPANAVLGGLLICQIAAGALYYSNWKAEHTPNAAPTVYNLAGDSKPDAAGGFVAIVKFRDSATLQEVYSFLDQQKAVIEQGTDNRYFKVRFASMKTDDEFSALQAQSKALVNSPVLDMYKFEQQ